MRPLPTRIAVALGVILASCGPDGPEAPGSTTALYATPADAGPVYATTPFPGDPWLEADGKIGPIAGLDLIAPLASDAIVAQLATLDGFATRPTIEIFLDGPIDPASLPARTSDATAPIFVFDASGEVVPFDWRWDPDVPRIAGSPVTGAVLEPGESYSFVVTRGVRAPDGPLARDPDFEAMQRRDASALPARWRTTRMAIDAAVTLGVRRDDVVAAMTFRVAHHRDVLLAARARMETTAAPQLTFPNPSFVWVGQSALDGVLGTPTLVAGGTDEIVGWDNPTGMAHAHIAAMATGTLTTVRFRRLDRPAPDAYAVDSGTIEVDANGAPVIVDAAFPIPITIAIPNGTMPPNGFPVVLYGHGLGASRMQMTMMMETAALAGYATIAIDASSHGSRYDTTDVKSNLASAIPSFTGNSSAPDGFGDNEGFTSTLALFHDLINVLAMRDEIRQTVLDWSQVVRMIRDPALDLSALLGGAASPAPRLDPAHVVYMGESFGGLVGGTFAAVEPHLNAAILCVPGGGFIDLSGAYSPTLRGLLDFGIPGTYGAIGTMNRFHPILGFGNALLDGADPIVFAPLVLYRSTLGALEGRGRDVIILEAMGDEVLSNVGTEALAQAMGLDLLGPSFSSIRNVTERPGTVGANVAGRTGLLLQFATATHGEVWSKTNVRRSVLPFSGEAESWPQLPTPIAVTNPVGEVRGMLETLLLQVRADEVLHLAHPAPPVHDFDDDGVLDDVDPTPNGY